MKKALIIVDVQNDFLPEGSLAVPESDKIIPIINKLMKKKKYDLIVFTFDWHPKNHCSFSIWPEHCIEGTFGSLLSSKLDTPSQEYTFIFKGQNIDVDSYSGFFDNDHKTKTSLETSLNAKNITNVDIVGLAYNFCVAYTALDAVKLGFKTTIIKKATKAIGDYTEIERKMLEKGIKII